MGRIEYARSHHNIFAETFTDSDPEVAHLLDEARDALREAERRAGYRRFRKTSDRPSNYR